MGTTPPSHIHLFGPYFLLWFWLPVACAVLGGELAKRKGYPFVIGGLLGAFLSIVGLVIVLVLPNRRRRAGSRSGPSVVTRAQWAPEVAAGQAGPAGPAAGATPRPQEPGWYRDPDGMADLRWWDGRIWTHHTHSYPR